MNPKPGEIWQHFKGTNYHILGVSGLLLIPDYPPHYWAKHTETEEILAVYHHIESESSLTLTRGDGLTVINEPHVLYFGTLDAVLVWARSLNNFLSNVVCQDGARLRFKKVSA